MRKIDMIGVKSERLTVISESGKTKDGRTVWLCECLCGNMVNVTGKQIRNKNTKSCGCLKSDVISSIKKKHGLSNSRTYKIWTGMIQRCTNKKVECYYRYGGSGITVCDRWLNSFENFIEDMGHAPNGMQIDRIDFNGDYEPSNCKWSSVIEQARNKKNNRIIKIGNDKKCVSEWASIFNIHPDLIFNRLRRGWDEIKAVTEPVRNRNKSDLVSGSFGSTGISILSKD